MMGFLSRTAWATSFLWITSVFQLSSRLEVDPKQIGCLFAQKKVTRSLERNMLVSDHVRSYSDQVCKTFPGESLEAPSNGEVPLPKLGTYKSDSLGFLDHDDQVWIVFYTPTTTQQSPDMSTAAPSTACRRHLRTQPNLAATQPAAARRSSVFLAYQQIGKCTNQ